MDCYKNNYLGRYIACTLEPQSSKVTTSVVPREHIGTAFGDAIAIIDVKFTARREKVPSVLARLQESGAPRPFT